jgi:MoxR-like ATPase
MTSDTIETEASAPVKDGAAVVAEITAARDKIRHELQKAIVGQEEIIEQIIIALLSRGHCLMTGVPGLGKTMLVRSIAEIFSLSFRRIQFTPDLMPADISGTEIVEESTGHLRKLRQHSSKPWASDR